MNQALFINGVFESVLEEILKAQSKNKDLICYLQPYSTGNIKYLKENDFNKNPSITFYLSITTSLNQVCYIAEIVGWYNKKALLNDKEKLAEINNQISGNQPIQREVYFYADNEKTKECANLILVKSLKKLIVPFPTGSLIKISDNIPLKPRTQAGGCSVVQEIPFDLIEATHFAIKENEDKELLNNVEKSLKDSSESRRERLATANKKPEVFQIISRGYKRNSDVIAEVLVRAIGICEKCKSNAPFIRKKNNTPYLEVHHKIQLAEGGEDTVDNSEALCPNCHREKHFGI
ncbi:MAG: HNH endonuclease signature motif containing protein [Methylococcales bacterium]|nr:HNH endonuclease signature motif containing protein [Methylococcales bacterium]